MPVPKWLTAACHFWLSCPLTQHLWGLHTDRRATLCAAQALGTEAPQIREVRKSHGCLGGSAMEKGQAGGRPSKLAWLDAGLSKQWRVGMHEERGAELSVTRLQCVTWGLCGEWYRQLTTGDRLGGGYSHARGRNIPKPWSMQCRPSGWVLRALPAKTHKPWLQNTLVKYHS